MYDFADDPLSKLASLAPSAEAAAAAQRQPPPVQVQPLQYIQRAPAVAESRRDRIDPNTGELIDPLRDYIAPSILLAVGLGGIVVDIMQKKGTGPLALFAISVVVTITLIITLIKMAVVTAAAVPLAQMCDVNVGLLRTALLKFASIILLGDTAILWLIVAMRSAGMIGPRDDGGPLAWVVDYVFLVLVYYVCFLYLFRLSLTDMKFAWLIALVSRLCNFVIWLAAVAVILALASSRSQPGTSAIKAAPVIPPGTPLTVQAGMSGPTQRDMQISLRIKQNPTQIIEGYAWCRNVRANDAVKKLISDLYNAGASRVYVDGFIVYAELPTDPAKHAVALDVADAFRTANGTANNAHIDSLDNQYAVVALLPQVLHSTGHH